VSINNQDRFEKWFEPKYARMEDSVRFVAKRIAYSGWQAAQADKLNFARQCVVAALAEAINTDACDVNVTALIAKVEQEQ
jgi:hypothetical protein